MSESAEVRLVRCPKCENLLPEVTEFSVYLCGGCGAVLRANEECVELDTFSDKSYQERIGMMKQRFPARYDHKMDLSEERMMSIKDGYDGDRMSKMNSSSRAEVRTFPGRAENCRHGSINKEEKWDDEVNVRKQASVAQEFGNLALYGKNEDRWERSAGFAIRRIVERSSLEGYSRRHRMDAEDVRYTKSISSEESGHSNHLSSPRQRYDFPIKNVNNVHEFNLVDRIEDDMPELSNQFQGMQDQPSHSGNLSNKVKGRAFLHRGVIHQDSYCGAETQYPENYMGIDSSGPSLMRRQELAGNGFRRPLYISAHVQEYGDPLPPRLVRKGPFQTSAPSMAFPSHPYSSGSCKDDGMAYLDQLEPYHPNFPRHHPSCSCFQCCNLRHGPPPVLTTVFPVDSRYSKHRENPVSFDQRYNNSRAPNAPPPLRFHPRMQFPSAGLHCRPIAGGSPFILCNNCLELLLLPESFSRKSDRRRKIKCGVCSSVVVFTFSDQKLVFCTDAESKDATFKVDENGNKGELHEHGHISRNVETCLSDDYDNMGCDFLSMDREPEQMLSARGRVNDSSETKRGFSTSTHTTDLEEVTKSEMENENVPRESSEITKQKDVIRETSPPADLSLKKYSENSNIFRVKNSQGELNTSGNSKHEKWFPKESTAGQISVDLTSATETDVSSNDFTNTGTSSSDSGYASRKGRTGQSFFAGITKKSFKEVNKSNQNLDLGKAGVMVNGHFIPEELIKKAEKVAGPISQGNYWYDHRAGFWGAMGGPCLGMIPPGIEEFNYQMPERCSGGNTDIFVNGRELNQKDMNLLRRRGFPADRYRSYKVEISGRIIDSDTGKELESLGNLAPTIQRIQHGFGMRVPKAAP